MPIQQGDDLDDYRLIGPGVGKVIRTKYFPMDILSKFFNPIIGLVITLIFGFWLSRRGKPYHGLLFNVHKLVALGTVILAAVSVYRLLAIIEIERLAALFLVLAAASAIALFASGALMSAGKGEYHLMKSVHNLAPVAAILAMTFAVYLLGASL